jgi:hypothetical protein
VNSYSDIVTISFFWIKILQENKVDFYTSLVLMVILTIYFFLKIISKKLLLYYIWFGVDFKARTSENLPKIKISFLFASFYFSFFKKKVAYWWKITSICRDPLFLKFYKKFPINYCQPIIKLTRHTWNSEKLSSDYSFNNEVIKLLKVKKW